MLNFKIALQCPKCKSDIPIDLGELEGKVKLYLPALIFKGKSPEITIECEKCGFKLSVRVKK